MNSYEYQDCILSSDLSAKAKLVAIAISYHYNWKESTDAWPSVDTISIRTSLSKSSVNRAKIELVENGYLGSERRFNKSNLYEPQIPNTFTQTLPRVTQTPHTFTQTPPSVTVTPLEGSQRLTNNEYNYELNNEKNNEMNIISVPEIMSISINKVEDNGNDIMKKYLQSQAQLEIEKAASVKEWINS